MRSELIRGGLGPGVEHLTDFAEQDGGRERFFEERGTAGEDTVSGNGLG